MKILIKLQKTFPFLILFLSSCSLFSSYSPTPEVKAAVANISIDYLQSIIDNNSHNITTFLFPEQYFNDSTRSITSFNQQLLQMQSRWKPEENPFRNLQLVEVEVEENDATVIFKNPSPSLALNTIIKLRWVLNAWYIVDDSIFGKGNLLEKLLLEKQNT